MNDFGNPQVAALPGHLRQYIVEQHYEHYTPVDQAVWRYVMRQNYANLKDVAYYPYIPGLKAAGLSIEHIPNLQEMNDALGKIGWGAVTVDGFIPPAAFMEYQAYRVLVIAADIRQLQHIEYTPAPDIIHESAGHAPIIADPDYNRYLSYFGSIGAKAMYSAQDYELYEAIRALSILKEMPNPDAGELQAAVKRVAYWQENMGEPSEMALLSRLHWWTVEYGLIGTLDDPKIYGAGLLSSIGESGSCMQPKVLKLWYTPEAVNYAYDITRPQEQLFVTPDFQNLIDVLENFADQMAFRTGGIPGLQKAVDSKQTCTVVYNSGLQVSGTLAGYQTWGDQAAFVHFDGPVALACKNQQLEGHGKTYHVKGYSSPVGKRISGDLTPGPQVWRYESGICVEGNLTRVLYEDDKAILATFEDSTVSDANGMLLFRPEWGNHDLAIGESIVSVFSGAADKNNFDEMAYRPKTMTYHPNYDNRTLELQNLYRQVREAREQHHTENLEATWQKLLKEYPEDWLCALEILEMLPEQRAIEDFLNNKTTDPKLTKLIRDGLHLLKSHPAF